MTYDIGTSIPGCSFGSSFVPAKEGLPTTDDWVLLVGPLSLPRALCAFFLALLSPMPSQNRWEDLRCLRDGAAWVLLYQACERLAEAGKCEMDKLCKEPYNTIID